MVGTVLKKSMLLQSLQNFPDEVNSEDVIERVLFLAQIERGLKQIQEGKVSSHEQVMQELAALKAKKQAELH